MAQCQLQVEDERFYQLVGDQFQVEELFDNAVWAEGPAWRADEKALVFSDVKGNTMYRWHAETGTQIFRRPSNFANGNTVDLKGDLITCSHGARAILRTDKAGNIHTVIDNLEGKRLNSPNDVVVKSDGTIWFSDPPYGILSDNEGKKSPSEIYGCYVYCFDPNTNELNIATFNVMRPNGLAFSPDERQLFVADMSAFEFEREGLHHLVAFDVEGKRLKNRRDVAEITPGIPDGLRINRFGVIFCSCENGLMVLLPDGTLLARIILNKCVSNCNFGDDEKTLFVTATNSLYRIQF